mmetsp:Transcript_5862/g.12009  ORF Transcript_5862/g.12009 Transcript_5862/m.12009 type:complete len:105 (+) Transcript_5862:400-714(+)
MLLNSCSEPWTFRSLAQLEALRAPSIISLNKISLLESCNFIYPPPPPPRGSRHTHFFATLLVRWCLRRIDRSIPAKLLLVPSPPPALRRPDLTWPRGPFADSVD